MQAQNILENIARADLRRKIYEAFNWRAIVKECEASDAYTPDGCGDGDSLEKSVYLGSVLSLAPSGKYYTAFASSNVAACARCKGSGETRQLFKCQTCDGAGRREALGHYNLAYISECAGHAVNVGDSFDCQTCKGSGKTPRACAHCGGVGSREAWLDSIYFEELDAAAEKHGGYITRGDGDALDIFFAMSIETDADADESAPEDHGDARAA